MQKSEKRNPVSLDKIEKALEELQEYIRTRVHELENRINNEKHEASEYYISDMKGFVRGTNMMGDYAVSFLKKKLMIGE